MYTLNRRVSLHRKKTNGVELSHNVEIYVIFNFQLTNFNEYLYAKKRNSPVSSQWDQKSTCIITKTSSFSSEWYHKSACLIT